MPTKKDQLVIQSADDDAYTPPAGDDPEDPVEEPVPTPQTGETTRVFLTDDNRIVLTEHYVPTEGFGFRIFIEGMGHFEHVAEAADSGTWIFAPTR